MAVTIKTKGGTVVSVADLLKAFQKDLGKEIGSFGGKLKQADRVPTGVFELDLALGGGIPRGKCTMIYGPESSSKTNLAYLAIANNQKLRPHETNAFIDVEHAWDPVWAKQLGVDVEKVAVIEPDFAEQVVDIVESLLMADDCGVVVIDSLAALMTTAEAEAGAERANVGGAAVVIGKLYRKTTQALRQAEKRGRQPTLIYINQIIYKIGVMYGNPETVPGGKKPFYQSSIILRVYGKNIVDKKISQALPVGKEVNYTITKFKVPILRLAGTFTMTMMAHSGLRIGQSDDFNSIKTYLTAFGMWEKDKKGWKIVGDVYPLQDDFKTKIYGDHQFGTEIRQAIISRLKTTELVEPGAVVGEDDIVEEDDE